MIALYYYFTLAVLFTAALFSAGSFSGYLVSRRKSFLIGAVIFAAYFVDISVVFFHDFSDRGVATALAGYFEIQQPALSILTGALTSGGIWMLVCEKLDLPSLKKWDAMLSPIAIYALASAMVYFLVQDAQLRCFIFFTLRQLLVLFATGVYLTRYSRLDTQGRLQIRPKLYEMLLLVLLTTCVIGEDIATIFFLVPQYGDSGSVSFSFFAERNFAENALYVWLGIVVVKDAWKTVHVHAKVAPVDQDDKKAVAMEAILPRYSALHELSPREQDVLRLILQGKDTHNIASELTLAPGTVKRHIHNLLKKTDMPNRQELVEDFWKKH